MAPILYYLDASPPVRAVLLTAKALDLDLELRKVNLVNEEQKTPEYLKMNPQHTIPTLDDNGFIIWDSHAINAYLVGKYAKDDSLYPKDLQKRALIDQRLHFDSGILFPRLRSMFLPVISLRKNTIPEDLQEDMREGYNFMETFLEGRDYLTGPQVTIADFSAVSTLTSVLPVVPPQGSSPNITRWLKNMEKLPYYQEANGNGAEACAKYVIDKLQQ